MLPSQSIFLFENWIVTAVWLHSLCILTYWCKGLRFGLRYMNFPTLQIKFICIQSTLFINLKLTKSLLFQSPSLLHFPSPPFPPHSSLPTPPHIPRTSMETQTRAWRYCFHYSCVGCCYPSTGWDVSFLVERNCGGMAAPTTCRSWLVVGFVQGVW